MMCRANPLYIEDIESVLKLNCDFLRLKDKSVLITGATGLIGTVLVDMLIFLSGKYSLNLKLFLVSRSVESHSEKKADCLINYIRCDIAKENITEKLPEKQGVDFIFHLASTTHPAQYSQYPVETVLTNFEGTRELLELASVNKSCRFLLTSSVEIYGNTEVKNADGLSETDSGYIDCNTVRACYNEAKRLSETLCAAYKSEKNTDYVTARLCRCYGPTLRKGDTKALSQFIERALSGKDIVLKSDGTQYFSYLYASDAACALIFLLLNGKSGEAYNVADKKSNIHLRDLAELTAKETGGGIKVVFENPELITEKEKTGYSLARNAVLNPEKLNALGFSARVSIEEGIRRTIGYFNSTPRKKGE